MVNDSSRRKKNPDAESKPVRKKPRNAEPPSDPYEVWLKEYYAANTARSGRPI